jgi:hypothetical protein
MARVDNASMSPRDIMIKSVCTLSITTIKLVMNREVIS